jgi:GntR family transcriptional regulator, N-acetylglucosamine utilization regulator
LRPDGHGLGLGTRRLDIILYVQDDEPVADLRGRIDRRSPIPYYFQLKRLVEDEVRSGRWAPGTRLPSEAELCERFTVSRTTVRQALGELEREGTLRKEKGRGTFVAEPVVSSWLLQSSHGFHEDATREGKTVTSLVLRCELEVLPDWAADALGMPPGSHGVTLERVRSVDGQLAMYVVNHLAPQLADTVLAADLEHGSLYGTLADREGLAVAGGRRVVEAATAADELARLLSVEPGAPLLFVESVSWDADQRPFECYRAWHRSDRSKIEVQVVGAAEGTTRGATPRHLTG